MFSGIIEKTGKIKQIGTNNSVIRLVIETNFNNLLLGESIAINGICLTLVDFDENLIAFDVVPETLKVTNLSKLKVGSIVNLERSLKVGSDISGHLVSGHVDCLIKLINIENLIDSYILTFEMPNGYEKFVATKGSVCISGISLTVVERNNNIFSVAIIPHTWEVTNLKYYNVGDELNFEVDMFARYVVNALDLYKEEKNESI